MSTKKKLLLCLSVGGVVLIGLAIYVGRAAANTRGSAVAFVRDALDRLTVTWEPEDLFAMGTPELQRRHSSSRDALAESMSEMERKLGRVRAVEVTRSHVNRHYSGEAATTTVTLILLGEFESGSARIDVVLVRGEDGQWAIDGIGFHPE